MRLQTEYGSLLVDRRVQTPARMSRGSRGECDDTRQSLGKERIR